LIVIPMAGLSRRFTDAGYERPKYMLDLSGRPLFDWAVLSFSAWFSSIPMTFVLRDEANTARFVEQRLAALGITDARIVVLDAPTAGQAETVEKGLQETNTGDDTPLAIFNIDTIRPGLDPRPMPGYDGWLEVFEAVGENWSFIETAPDDPLCVVRCTEKQRISNHCCTGLYQFASTTLFASALEQERRCASSHELFVAPLYNHLIAQGARIGWRAVPADQVVLSGVPAEYEALVANLPAALSAMERHFTKST